jgi:hypothetical protein
MRSQDHNPMYQQYSHLLAKSRRYYAKHVDIFRNVDESGKIREVEIVFIPRRDIPKHREDGGVWAEYSATTSAGGATSATRVPIGFNPVRCHLSRSTVISCRSGSPITRNSCTPWKSSGTSRNASGQGKC